MTVGGGTSKDSWVVALWKIESLLQLNESQATQIPIPESLQILSDVKEVYAARLIYNTEDDHVNFFVGTEQGLRVFLFKTSNQTLIE